MIDAFKEPRPAVSLRLYHTTVTPDRTGRPGKDPITAKLVANLITSAGADRVLTMDLRTSDTGLF